MAWATPSALNLYCNGVLLCVQNDILSRMMHEGVLQKKGEVVATNSPAMDIQVQANPFQQCLSYQTQRNFLDVCIYACVDECKLRNK